MKNFVRLVALLLVCLVFSMANADTHEAKFWFEKKPLTPDLVQDELQKSVFKITEPAIEIKCQGHDGAFNFNNEWVKSVSYNIALQYKIENGSWQDIKRYSGTWNVNDNAPGGWSGSLGYDHSTITINKLEFNNYEIPLDEKYDDYGVVNIDFRFFWNLRMDYEGKHYLSLQGETTTVSKKVYQCKAGEIDVLEETTIPKISKDVYGIYDTEEYKKSNLLGIYATSREVIEAGGRHYYFDNDGIEIRTAWNGHYPYQTDYPMTVENFENANKKNAVSQWSYTLRYLASSDKSVGCNSNSLTFRHYRRLQLGRLKNFEGKRYMCSSGSLDASLLTLTGVGVDFEQSGVNKEDLDVYGIEYGWEYSLNGQYWNEIKESSSATLNGMDITINSKFISNLSTNAEVVYFRPKVYLSTFKTDVYADADIVYEVIPYTKSTSNNMKLEISDKTVCAGVELDENHGIVTLKKKYGSDVFNPGLSYTIEPSAERFESVNAIGNELAKWHISDKLDETTTYTVTVVDDVCGSDDVVLQTTVKVEKVDYNPEDELTLEGCNYRFEDGKLYIQAKEGALLKFGKNSNNYKYILNDDSTQRLLPVSIPVDSIKNKRISLKKVNNSINSIKCEGEELPVSVEVVENIKGNSIYFEDKSSVKDNIYYLCKGDKNPKIGGSENIEGGYGEQKIIWRVRYAESSTSKQIPRSYSETYSLSAGIFDITEDCEIERVVSMGDGVFESVSNALKLKVYSGPEFRMTMNDSILSESEICFDENPSFNISYQCDEPKASDHVGKTTYRIKTYDAKDQKIDTLITVESKYDKWKFNNTATISATKLFCGTSVDVKNTIDLNVKADLTFSDNDFLYDCPMFGKEMEITPAIEDESKYTYRIGSKTYVDKVGTTKILLPQVNPENSVSAKVTRVLDGCDKTQTIKIKNVLTPLENRKLFLIESLDATNNLVCLQKEYGIADNYENDEANVRYSWSTKTTGSTIHNATSSKVRVSLLNGNDFIRTRVLGDNCEVKRDTIKVDVLAKSTTTPSIRTTSSVLCYGEDVKVSVDPIAGYKVTSFEKNGIETKLESDNSLTEFIKTSGDVTYSVEMTNEQCDNYVINAKTSIQVAPNLNESKTIKVSPSDLSKSLFGEKTKSVTVTLTDMNDLGQETVAFSFNGSDFKETQISEGVWSASFSIVEDDLDVDQMGGNVYRTYTFPKMTKTCVSDTFPIYVNTNSGFDQISINTVGVNLKADDLFYFCESGNLQLENEIVFNRNKLSTGEYELQWYRMTSSGVWFAMPGETKESVTISTKGLENRSEYYKLVVSLTKDGKSYKQASNVIEVRNVTKPNLNIRLSAGDMSFCYEGECEFKLQTITWSTPDGVVDAMNSYTWQKSYDGKSWSNLETESTEDIEVSMMTKKDVSTLSYKEEAMTKATYFRAVLTDLCDATATSNVLLTKTYKGMDLTAEDVNVMSSKLVLDQNDFEVKFYVNYSDDKIYSYTYYNEKNKVVESKGTAMQIFSRDREIGYSHKDFDYSFGKHKVYVEKVMVENGCKSDKVEVEYELIAPLKIDVQNGITNSCPNDGKQKGYINLVYLDGGIPDNGIRATWYYRYDDEEFFKKLDSTVNFSYSLKKNYKCVK